MFRVKHKGTIQYSLIALVCALLVSGCAPGTTPEMSIDEPTLIPTAAVITNTPFPSPTPTATQIPTSTASPEPKRTEAHESPPTIEHPEYSEADEEGTPQVNSQVREKDGATIIWIPEGPFTMGCDFNHNAGFECVYDELPLHTVYTSAYYIDKYEVTNGQYMGCVAAGFCEEPVYKHSLTRESYYGEPDFHDFPIIAITWFEANDYCHWVGGRLPTEAEWEKAAKGTRSKAFPWGDQMPDCDLANSYDNRTAQFCVGDTAKIGSYPAGASTYGVLDMAGNVWEWVNDWYSPEYYRYSPLNDPEGIETGSDKVIRGGGYDYSWGKLRIPYRSNHHPNQRHLSFGFRCVNPNINEIN